MSGWAEVAEGGTGETNDLDTRRGILPGPYDRAAGLRRIAAAAQRKEERVQRAKTTNRRRNKTARQSRRSNRKG